MNEIIVSMLLCFFTGFVFAKTIDSRDGCLKFYTKNKGRTWSWMGNEFRASELTDQLQNFYSKRIRAATKELFYND